MALSFSLSSFTGFCTARHDYSWLIGITFNTTNVDLFKQVNSILKRTIQRKIAFIVVVLLYLFSQHANAQKFGKSGEILQDTTDKVDVIDIIKSKFSFKTAKIKPRKGKKVYYSLLPVSIPGGGKALITSTSAGFYLGSRRNTFLSNVTFSPYLNFKGRYSLSFRSNIYTSKNLWNIQGDTRFSVYPEYTWGIKANGQQNEKIQLTYKYIRFYQTVLRRIKPYFLAGLGYYLDYHIDIKTLNDTIGLPKFSGYTHGTAPNSNSVSSGITFNLLYDTRNNSINPLPGAYANVVYRVNPSFLGNTGKKWNSLYLDMRKYVELTGRRRKVMAFWTYAWTALNNGVPYLDLPATGGDPYQRSGRGIDPNRYRGKTLFYLESEYRNDLTNNGLLGYVLFTNFNINSQPYNGSFTGPHAAAGAGLRIKFNKLSGTNIAFDVGVSKKNTSFTLNLGEAF